MVKPKGPAAVSRRSGKAALDAGPLDSGAEMNVHHIRHRCC